MDSQQCGAGDFHLVEKVLQDKRFAGRIEVAGGLVGENQRWARDESAANGAALFFSP